MTSVKEVRGELHHLHVLNLGFMSTRCLEENDRASEGGFLLSLEL